jgi:hypothetical protein
MITATLDSVAAFFRTTKFEDGSKFYDSCFQKDRDILLNPKRENGLAWDMLAEFDGDCVSFIETIIQAAHVDEADGKETEIYLADMLLNIEKTTSSDALNRLIFQPMKDVAPIILETLNAENNMEKYGAIRTRLALYLNFLKPAARVDMEISIRDYLENCDGKILFVSCFNDRNMIKLSELTLDASRSINILKIFSSKTYFKESRDSIIDARETNVFTANGSIFSSKSEILARNDLKKIFSDVLQNSELSHAAKIYGTDKIVLV